MLHLDQNHNTLSSPHSKPNVILSNTPRPDQHNLLSWSPPNRDERTPFFQEPQEHPVADKTSTPPIKPDAPAATAEASTEPAAATGPPVPGNAEDPKLSDQPPSTPDVTSPALDSTSSLTPPPSATSPAFSSIGLPDGDSSTRQKVEGTEEEEQTKVDGGGDGGDNASRASTPLSELSSAPGVDDAPAPEKKPEHEGEKPAVDGTEAAGANVNTASKGGENQTFSVPAETPNANDVFTGVDQRLRSSSRAPSIATPEPTAIYASSPGLVKKSDPKVEVLIELNSELLRVCMELQARGIAIGDAKAQQYSQRLQSNLTWMAAAVDQTRSSSTTLPPLPIFQAPPVLDFTSVDRIQQLYEELPKLFAKEIQRRRNLNGPAAVGLPAPNGHLKRDRPDDISIDSANANKRRDTGESKTSTPAPSTPRGTSSPIQPISATMTQPGTPTHPIGTPGLVGPSGSSPSMPPPSIPPGMMAGNEAQIAAQRARHMQMRQMQQQAMADGSRQMASGQAGMSMSGSSSVPPGTLAALQAMGPTAMQMFNILQNPQHPLVLYMTSRDPGFQSLPLQQRIQQMQHVQAQVQRNQQQQQRAANGQLAAMQGMSPTSGGPAGMVPNASPTRMSPSGQQTAMQQGFPFPGGNGGGGMDPRISNAMGSLTPAQQASLANMNPQQRQLFLLQQQQHQQQQMMRGGNAANPMMNQQMFNAAQQQRMAGSSPHIGSPMLGGSPDGANFPAALRSNPGVPGIARSARTPSDHAASPMTPQLSRGPAAMDDFQRSMMQQAQRNMQAGGMNQLSMGNAGWSQSQQNPMTPSQASFGAMSPPSSTSGFSGMHGGSPSIGGHQQWSPNGNASFPFNVGSPGVNASMDPTSRQASATPAPQQMAQNSPLPGDDQTGLTDFDIFPWGQ